MVYSVLFCVLLCRAMLHYALLSYAVLHCVGLCRLSVLYCAALRYAMLCYAMLRCFMLHYALLHSATLCCVVLCCAALRFVVLRYVCCVMLRYIVPCCAVLHCALLALCSATLCCVMLCYAVLCCTAHRFAVLHYCIMVHCTVLHCAVLRCYAALLCCAVLSRSYSILVYSSLVNKVYHDSSHINKQRPHKHAGTTPVLKVIPFIFLDITSNKIHTKIDRLGEYYCALWYIKYTVHVFKKEYIPSYSKFNISLDSYKRKRVRQALYLQIKGKERTKNKSPDVIFSK